MNDRYLSCLVSSLVRSRVGVTPAKMSNNIRRRRKSPLTDADGKLNTGEHEHLISSSSQAITRKDDTVTNPPIYNQREAKRSQPDIAFHVTKSAILRLVGFVYFITFLGAYNQNRGLMGKNGLMPAHAYMDQLRQRFDSSLEGFLAKPTLYWFLESPLEDWHMEYTAVVGMVLSSFVVMGLDSWLVMAALWMLDFSIVTVAEGATEFYSYGWESQLLETGFLAIWLCDLPSFGSFRGLFYDTPPSAPSLTVLWLFRWLCARISIGAGLIKLRGAQCWQDKTCLYYHFETQPIPSPMSFIFHFLPKSVLRRAVDLDYFVQLYTIWMVLLPGFHWTLTYLRRCGGFIQAGFMVNIILSGNFAFLNHLTIIPALAALDDACCPNWLKNFVYRKKKVSNSHLKSGTIRILVDLSLLVLIGMLSVPVVTNLLQLDGNHQVMNASFNSFKLVNSYGAFGSVGMSRYEPIISVSNDGQDWFEIELPCKPGRVERRPCFCAPYHYRLDWNIWFIGFKPHQAMLQRREQWMFSLVQHILADDTQSERPWLELLDKSAQDLLKKRVKYVKVDMYNYKMKDSLWNILIQQFRGSNAVWWTRTFEETLIRPVELQPSSGNLMYANLKVN